MIFRLIDDLIFPDPDLAEEDGLLAIGGDLSPERLILAYKNGIFPWFSDDSPILWYSPHERFVLFPSNLYVSKSLNKIVKSGIFKITVNKAFENVISACADVDRKHQAGTWITDEMQLAYKKLHAMGIAQSIEVWENEVLVGGLYGVKVGRVFCGESMFSLQSNASKVALVYLCKQQDYEIIDCQIYSEHLESMGARTISRKEFMSYLKD